MHEVVLCQIGTEMKKKKPETKWKFGENAKHEKLKWTAFEYLMVLLKRGKTERKEKPLFNIQRGMLHFWVGSIKREFSFPLVKN